MTEDSNLNDNIKLCECGCGKPTNIYKGRYSRFLHSHNLKTINQSGENHWNWKGGRVKVNGYWYIYKPNHYFANNRGYYAEHRWVYEQYYNVCLLPWVGIHHINEKRDDNRIENLRPMFSSDHAILHQTKNMSDRFCNLCNTNETRWWYIDINGFLCYLCYSHISYLIKYKKKEIRKPRKKKDTSDRYCSDCGSYKTCIDKYGSPVWARDGKGGWLDKNCNLRKWRRLNKNLN